MARRSRRVDEGIGQARPQPRSHHRLHRTFLTGVPHLRHARPDSWRWRRVNAHAGRPETAYFPLTFLMAAAVLVARISTICLPRARALSLSAIETPLIVALPAFTRSAQRTDCGSVTIMLSVMPASS